MAGDTGSPQCQPTDLSMKTRRETPTENDKIETYNYENATVVKDPSSWRKLNDLAMYYANQRTEKVEYVHKHRKARTPGPETSEKAIKEAINAITKSLTPTSSCIRSIQGGRILPTPVSDEDLPPILRMSRKGGCVTRITPVSSSNSSPDMEVVEREIEAIRRKSPPMPFTKPVLSLEDHTGAAWRFPAMNRPTYLDLRQVSSLHTPTENMTPSPKSIFGGLSQQSLAEVMASPPETPGSQGKSAPKRRKRKLGPGRGWKFHDLSNDGGVNKKRTYAHNKLENEILQRFQDRVCVKTLPTPDGSKDKLIIVEPSEIIDIDLIRCGTALRMIFDKEAGTYKLQLLPYTLEEGPLSNQEKVMQAVASMLGESNQVLCPCAYQSFLRTGSGVIISEQRCEGGEAPSSPEQQYGGRQKTLVAPPVQQTDIESPLNSKEPFEKQRNRLLWSLNNDLTRNNNVLVGASAAGRKVCMMWHIPQMAPVLGRPGSKKSTPLTKWCANCQASVYKKS